MSSALSFEPDRWLHAGDKVGFGEIELDVLHCPGRTPAMWFFHEPRPAGAGRRRAVPGSIGRTDFPRGDYDTLIPLDQRSLFPLGDDVEFICGLAWMSNPGYRAALALPGGRSPAS